MSCYFRHLKGIFAEAGIQVTSSNRKQVDQALHQIVGVEYKECPSAWKKLKLELADERKRQELIRKLQNAVR